MARTAKMSKPRRMVWRVHWRTKTAWTIKDPRGKSWDSHYWLTKQDAVIVAIGAARYWRESGGLAQVVIYGKNGRIQREHTYGKDPKRFKG